MNLIGYYPSDDVWIPDPVQAEIERSQFNNLVKPAKEAGALADSSAGSICESVTNSSGVGGISGAINYSMCGSF